MIGEYRSGTVSRGRIYREPRILCACDDRMRQRSGEEAAVNPGSS